MNILATLNLGGVYLTDNTRASFVDAAARWGLQYFEIVCSRDASPFVTKLCLWDYLPSGCDRVMFIDGDTLIREDCPCPLLMVPATHLGVVPNFQGEYGWSVPAEYHENCKTDWDSIAPRFNCQAPYDPATFWNSGMVVAARSHHESTWRWTQYVTRCLVKEYDKIPPNWEQLVMNMGFATCGIPLAVLDTTFNKHGPSVWNSDTMNGLITHYAGSPPEGVSKRGKLETVPWRAVP